MTRQEYYECCFECECNGEIPLTLLIPFFLHMFPQIHNGLFIYAP